MEIRRYAMGIATNSIILWMKPGKLTEKKQRNKTMIRKSIIINYDKTFFRNSLKILWVYHNALKHLIIYNYSTMRYEKH